MGTVWGMLVCCMGNDGWDVQALIGLAGTEACSGERELISVARLRIISFKHP